MVLSYTWRTQHSVKWSYYSTAVSTMWRYLPALHNVLDITDTHIVPELKIIFPNLINLCACLCVQYYLLIGVYCTITMVSFPFPIKWPGYETVSINVVLIPLQLVHQLEAELEDYEQSTGYSFSVSRPTVFQVDTSP